MFYMSKMFHICNTNDCIIVMGHASQKLFFVPHSSLWYLTTVFFLQHTIKLLCAHLQTWLLKSTIKFTFWCCWTPYHMFPSYKIYNCCKLCNTWWNNLAKSLNSHTTHHHPYMGETILAQTSSFSLLEEVSSLSKILHHRCLLQDSIDRCCGCFFSPRQCCIGGVCLKNPLMLRQFFPLMECWIRKMFQFTHVQCFGDFFPDSYVANHHPDARLI
jgi:hypothetical protein